jgi:hypothetical protein
MGAQKPGLLRKYFVKTRRLGKKSGFEESEWVSPVIVILPDIILLTAWQFNRAGVYNFYNTAVDCYDTPILCF